MLPVALSCKPICSNRSSFFNNMPKHCGSGLFPVEFFFHKQQCSVYGAEWVAGFILYYHVTLCDSLMCCLSFCTMIGPDSSGFSLRLCLLTHSIIAGFGLFTGFIERCMSDIYLSIILAMLYSDIHSALVGFSIFNFPTSEIPTHLCGLHCFRAQISKVVP